MCAEDAPTISDDPRRALIRLLPTRARFPIADEDCPNLSSNPLRQQEDSPMARVHSAKVRPCWVGLAIRICGDSCRQPATCIGQQHAHVWTERGGINVQCTETPNAGTAYLEIGRRMNARHGLVASMCIAWASEAIGNPLTNRVLFSPSPCLTVCSIVRVDAQVEVVGFQSYGPIKSYINFKHPCHVLSTNQMLDIIGRKSM